MTQKITKNLTANDLRGCIENYPIGLVELMITRAQQSCATYNNTKEILDILESCPNLAFDWRKTPEGHDFWLDVIVNNNFKAFFDFALQKGYKGDSIIEVYRWAFGEPSELFESHKTLCKKYFKKI